MREASTLTTPKSDMGGWSEFRSHICLCLADLTLSRHGLPEERDPYRLRDRNGAPVVCFQCGQSALPDASLVPSDSKRPKRSNAHRPAPIDVGRPLASCDYCDLHWHLDCLDPPMVTLPSFGKKWMCPAHADHVVVSAIICRARLLSNPRKISPRQEHRGSTTRQ
jgi:hypothetical protein